MYKNATFPFTVSISSNYPHQAPKVRCTKKVSVVVHQSGFVLTCSYRRSTIPTSTSKAMFVCKHAAIPKGDVRADTLVGFQKYPA